MSRCLYCDHDLPLHTTLDGERTPQLNDISLCIGCGGLHIFVKDGLRKTQIEVLDEETQKEVKSLEAWLKSRVMMNAKEKKK